MSTPKKLDGTIAFSFLWNNATPYSPDYRVCGVAKGPDGHKYIGMLIRVDADAPGDRITQPSKNGQSMGGNLGHCAAFSKVVKVDFGGARGPISLSGKYVISDSVTEDWSRFGEDIDSDKWAGLRAKRASSGTTVTPVAPKIL